MPTVGVKGLILRRDVEDVKVYSPTSNTVVVTMRIVGVSATHVYMPASEGRAQSMNSRDLVVPSFNTLSRFTLSPSSDGDS